MFRLTPVFASLLLLSPSADAFTVKKAASITPAFSRSVRLAAKDEKGESFFMEESEGSEDKSKFITSVFNKELAFDEKSGRFFETGFGEGDCIPDEEFCMVDNESGNPVRLTVEEKERIFLDALQSYYVSGRQMLSDSEFDRLKEDLEWNGSPLVAMNQKEVRYMAAMQEYMKGTPMMSDEEFDKLKKELKEEGSKFAVDTEPKCYIDTGICKVTFQPDNFRNNLLYLPAGSILFVIWLFFSYELINPILPVNPVILAAIGLPFIYGGSKAITDNFIFVDNKVLYGPCPNCSFENRVYFGNILGVEGFKDVATSRCPNCKTEFSLLKNTMRASTIVPKA